MKGPKAEIDYEAFLDSFHFSDSQNSLWGWIRIQFNKFDLEYQEVYQRGTEIALFYEFSERMKIRYR